VVSESARALSASARRAGYAPLAVDFFGDLDLDAVAAERARVRGDLKHGFEWRALRDALDALAADRTPVGVVCGTGFENRPALLGRLAERWPLFGNSAEAVRLVKDPECLEALCARLGIPHPRFSLTRPAGPDWLSKQTGGAGGSHVSAEHDDGRAQYWQQRVAGEPISALVLGAGSSALVLGSSAQWPDPTPEAPFRYGGAVRPAALPAAIEAALADAARSIVEAAGLVGLNSVDFLVAEDDWHLIEINPRPGATLDIFEPAAGGLFALHVAACRGELPAVVLTFAGAAAARTVYARRAIASVAAIAWPDWTADRQPPGTSVDRGAPLCTVLAEAETPVEARHLVERRAEAIRAVLGAG
jgi:predicted ATP-grasp superfamily ATP-dependent carboligase